MKNISNDVLARELDALAAIEPNGFPFVSLYVNAQADQHGRDNFDPFVRKEIAERGRTFADGSPELDSFERSAARIERFLRDELKPSANGAVVFASSGEKEFFKAFQLEAPIHKNRLHVSDRPFIYPLARLIDQNPVYVALVADTNAARIFVIELGRVRRREELDAGGREFAVAGEWSQMRYRRRVENHQQIHARETIEALDRIVREENAERVILAGDEIIIALLRQRLPARLADKVIDVLRLDIRAPEHEIIKATIESLREDNLQTDAEKVRDLFDQHRAAGLAAVGLEKTMHALVNGQADELLLSASLDDIWIGEEEEEAGAESVGELTREMIANALVSLARKSGAEVTFIEQSSLLAPVGGVGAFLRYRLDG